MRNNSIYRISFYPPYNQIVITGQPLQNIQSIVDRFNESIVPSYIQKELALGLEKTLKQYHKLSDGIAYTELVKLKQWYIENIC